MGRVAGPVKASLDKIRMEKPQCPRQGILNLSQDLYPCENGLGIWLGPEPGRGHKGGMLGEQQGAWQRRRPSSSVPTVGLYDLRSVSVPPFLQDRRSIKGRNQEPPAGVSRDFKAVLRPHTLQFNNGPLLSCALLQGLQVEEKASSCLAGEDSSDSCYGTDEP